MFIVWEKLIYLESATVTDYSQNAQEIRVITDQSSHIPVIHILYLVFQDSAVTDLSFAFSCSI